MRIKFHELNNVIESFNYNETKTVTIVTQKNKMQLQQRASTQI